MLVKCPECELQISDKAIFCPHCGFPIQKGSITPITSSKTHTKRLPNGFGQITKISKKNLRNPYRAMVTVGKDEYGKPISKLLKPQAYFPTYNDAYAALVQYNKDPYDLTNNTTLSELYDMWKESKKYKALKENTRKAYSSVWNHCGMISSVQVVNLRIKHVRACMDSFESVSSKKTLKALLSVLLDFAIQYEIIDRNCVREYKLDDETPVVKEHLAFTEEEMERLWEYQHIGCCAWVLIQSYTGMRPTELMDTKLENIHLEEGYIIAGIKTKAGTNRTIPIHSKVKPLIKKLSEQSKLRGSEYLLTTDKINHVTYDQYQSRFKKLIETLDLNKEHRLHDPRKQFITMAKKYNVNDFAIKRIVGHAIQDITENLYTERSLEWLQSEIEKIV